MTDSPGGASEAGGVGVPTLPLGPAEIEAILPHRPPFLFLDQVTELEPGVRAVGFKAVSAGEPHFTGHFPGRPIMPGVLIIEALAQLGAVCLLAREGPAGRLVLFGGIKDARFRVPVLPGQLLRLEIEVTRSRGPIGQGRARAFLGDGRLAAEAELTFAVVMPRDA
ncbi:MAG: 3-hydroxyacyl-ACP dehydratase FabZ [Bacillota bacterium]|nr:3-hydroxyacyl-ACP dehydratase FabZ [Bacillota bacterium]